MVPDDSEWQWLQKGLAGGSLPGAAYDAMLGYAEDRGLDFGLLGALDPHASGGQNLLNIINYFAGADSPSLTGDLFGEANPFAGLSARDLPGQFVEDVFGGLLDDLLGSMSGDLFSDLSLEGVLPQGVDVTQIEQATGEREITFADPELAIPTGDVPATPPEFPADSESPETLTDEAGIQANANTTQVEEGADLSNILSDTPEEPPDDEVGTDISGEETGLAQGAGLLDLLALFL